MTRLTTARVHRRRHARGSALIYRVVRARSDQPGAVVSESVVRCCIRCIWLSLILLLCSPVLHAEDYDVTVAINGKTTSEESVAYRSAMRIVILREARRTGGDRSVLEREQVLDALRSAENWVLQVSARPFESTDVLTEQNAKTSRVRETGVATHWLSVGFPPESIQQLVAQAQQSGQTTAPAAAAPTNDVAPQSALVWMLIVDGERSILIGGENGVNIMNRARELAGGVGFTTYFPALDLEDTQAVQPETMQSGDEPVLLAASERYGQPVVVSAILTREDGRRWNTRWSRYFNEQVTDQSFTAPSLDRALQQGIGWITGSGSVDPVLSRNAGNQSGNGFSSRGTGLTAGESLIWVGGVVTTAQYAKLINMISDIDGARVVYPKEVNQSGVLLGIQPQSVAQTVAARLSQSGVIRQSNFSPLAEAGPLAARADIFMQYDQ